MYQWDEIICHYGDNGIELLRIYQDKGIGGVKVGEDGLTVECEGLKSMFADIEFVAVDCVVVLFTLRLWRSGMAKVLIQRGPKRHRVDVRTVEQQSKKSSSVQARDSLWRTSGTVFRTIRKVLVDYNREGVETEMYCPKMQKLDLISITDLSRNRSRCRPCVNERQ